MNLELIRQFGIFGVFKTYYEQLKKIRLTSLGVIFIKLIHIFNSQDTREDSKTCSV